jgi:hypothetical protein
MTAGLQNLTVFDTVTPLRWIRIVAPKIVTAAPAPAGRRSHRNAPLFGPDPFPQLNTASAQTPGGIAMIGADPARAARVMLIWMGPANAACAALRITKQARKRRIMVLQEG